MFIKYFILATFCAAQIGTTAALCQSAQPLRLGIIGLDTSHVVAFTKVLNDTSSPDHVTGAKIIAAFKGGSPDVDVSRNRVEGFTAELRDKWGVQIVSSIEELCRRVDAVLLESVDGRPHLEQVKQVLAAKKPVFIDKPLATSYRDAKEIDRLAREAGVAWFSSSSLRFWEEIERLKNSPAVGKIIGVHAYGPSPTEPHHPDLMWYGIHAVEALFALMGPGCESVSRTHSQGADVVVGKWKDGRIGLMRGLREGKEEYGVTVFGEKGILHSEDKSSSYRPLLVQIVKFFQTGNSPVSSAETLEMFAFMEAADVSKKQGGRVVAIAEIQ